MYRESESFFLVRDILIKSIPNDITLKKKNEGDILLVTTQEYTLHFLNCIAKDFLELCDGERTLLAIAEVLIQHYDVDIDLLIDDLVDLIQDLQTKRIVYIEANYD